jgi:hypothetical protein
MLGFLIKYPLTGGYSGSTQYRMGAFLISVTFTDVSVNQPNRARAGDLLTCRSLRSHTAGLLGFKTFYGLWVGIWFF